jgi:hypothetical protein
VHQEANPDAATSEVYYAQLVEQEDTRGVLRALRQVVEEKGLFCALYCDRASHFYLTPRAGEMVDRFRLTQVGRCLQQLGIGMIAAYSPQARGRSERALRTWQGRLPQELRLQALTTVEQANAYLRDSYIRAFNRECQSVTGRTWSGSRVQMERLWWSASGKASARVGVENS